MTKTDQESWNRIFNSLTIGIAIIGLAISCYIAFDMYTHWDCSKLQPKDYNIKRCELRRVVNIQLIGYDLLATFVGVALFQVLKYSIPAIIQSIDYFLKRKSQ